jgi:hypothetical protein
MVSLLLTVFAVSLLIRKQKPIINIFLLDKKNNESCFGNNDCLSQNCVGSRCACKDNYELLADGRCSMIFIF